MSENMVLIVVAAISSVGGLLGGLLPGIIAAMYGRHKAKADAADIITQASSRAVELVQGQLDEMCTQFKSLDGKYRALKQAHDNLKRAHDKLQSAHDNLSRMFENVLTGAHKLRDQVIALKGIPVYEPPERRSGTE